VSQRTGDASDGNESDASELPSPGATNVPPRISVTSPHLSVEATPEDTNGQYENDESNETWTSQDALPNKRKDEVSAEVPKFGVSAESHRASYLETPIFEKNKA